MGQNKYKRKPPNRIQKDAIYIVCGGQTEQLYFEKFREKFKEQLHGRKIKTRKSNHDPLSIIHDCIAIRNQEKDCLKIWAVFDKDDFENFDNAIEVAQKNNIWCAFSNQAFEIWFINHYQRLDALVHRNYYPRKIKHFCGIEYEKNKKTLEGVINCLMDISKVEVAIENAENRFKHVEKEKQSERYSEYESCTTVYKLVKELLKHP